MANNSDVPFNLVRSKNVVGIKVTNSQNEDLGKIEEVVIDKISGETRYVVLSFGGIMGMGDKLFALPWKAISYNLNKNQFVLDIQKDKLKNAPGFDKDSWPNFAESAWNANVTSYYENI